LDSYSRRPASDPVGYSVLDLHGGGQSPSPMLLFAPGSSLFGSNRPPEEIHLDDADYPRILPEGVVEATTYAPPPFAPGAYVSIFGERFRPDGSQVLLDGADCPIAYVSTTQINIRLPEDIAPGPHALVVNSANRYSYPYRFEVEAQ